MTEPGDSLLGGDATEADLVEQLIPVEVSDDDPALDLTRVTVSRDQDAGEADLIDQALAVPMGDDDPDFDR